MRASIQDRNELMKAVVRAETLEDLKLYLISLVDAIDDLPEGKYDAPVPRYTAPEDRRAPAAGGSGPNGYHEPSLL